MMSLERVVVEVRGVRADELERWVGEGFVRPEGPPGGWVFHEMDVARVRLILELRDVLEVQEPALPTVLGLLDQLYDMRRRVKRLNEALGTVPEDVRVLLRGVLEG